MPKDARAATGVEPDKRIDGNPGGLVEIRPDCEPLSRRRDSVRRAGTGPRSDRTLTLATAAAEYVWMYDHRHGLSYREIAIREGVSVGRVRFGVKRARAQETPASSGAGIGHLSADAETQRPPRLVPLFPIGPYTPQSLCPHRMPIEQGSALCCMVCHRSGMDEHPAMQRDPGTDPSPEPRPIPTSAQQREVGARRETRKERRRRRFAQEEGQTQEHSRTPGRTMLVVDL